MKTPTYYEYRPNGDRYRGLLWAMEFKASFKLTESFLLSPGKRAGNWVSPKIVDYPSRDDASWQLEDGDFPALYDAHFLPVVSARAWNALAPLLGDAVEPLPVLHPARGYVLLNVLEHTDCVDLQRSTTTGPLPITGATTIYCFALRYERMLGRHVLRTSLQQGGCTLVDDEFRKIVEDNGLRGLVFSPLNTAE